METASSGFCHKTITKEKPITKETVTHGQWKILSFYTKIKLILMFSSTYE